MKEQILRKMIRESVKRMISESTITEASMSDIDIMAQEATDFKSFVKEFIKTHHDLSNAGEPGQFKKWLQSIYDNAKATTDESVVNGHIKKSEFDNADAEVSEQHNAMKTKIREAGGRRFAKTESIRQHTASKIKEANKKK